MCRCVGENKIENRSTFGEDMDKNLRLTFLATLYISNYVVIPDITTDSPCSTLRPV